MRGCVWLVTFSPPSMAMPKNDLVFFTRTICRPLGSFTGFVRRFWVEKNRTVNVGTGKGNRSKACTIYKALRAIGTRSSFAGWEGQKQQVGPWWTWDWARTDGAALANDCWTGPHHRWHYCPPWSWARANDFDLGGGIEVDPPQHSHRWQASRRVSPPIWWTMLRPNQSNCSQASCSLVGNWALVIVEQSGCETVTLSVVSRPGTAKNTKRMNYRLGKGMHSNILEHASREPIASGSIKIRFVTYRRHPTISTTTTTKL